LRDAFEGFVVDQFVDLVTGCEGFGVEGSLVFLDALLEAGGYSGVEMMERVGEDVDLGLVRTHS
jgi:hypothetical protein